MYVELREDERNSNREKRLRERRRQMRGSAKCCSEEGVWIRRSDEGSPSDPCSTENIGIFGHLHEHGDLIFCFIDGFELRTLGSRVAFEMRRARSVELGIGENVLVLAQLQLKHLCRIATVQLHLGDLDLAAWVPIRITHSEGGRLVAIQSG